MDAYPEITPLWDIPQPDLTQFADTDFLALLQKHYPTGDNSFGSFTDGVNPQNLSAYSLPSLTPPSEDSSPSPPNSNQDSHNDDKDDSALKRKASEESLSDEPSSKTQHTSDKKGSARRKSGGGTGKDETRLLKRKEQNRAAQRAFRERKEKHVKDLEDKVAELEAKNELAQHENENLKDMLSHLQNENLNLKQSSFTFTVPKTAGSENVKSPQQMFPTPSSSSATSPVSAPSPPKTTNPLDWSSLTTFDPSVLNLLDDSVPQPTATTGAMQMDFGFGGGSTGLASNSPYTTIASNPMFMSFASTFDSLSPPTEATSSTSPSSGSTPHNGSSAFNFDMNSLSSWPNSNNPQDPIFDDLFSSYLSSTNNSMEFTMSPASISPVAHYTTPPALAKSRSPLMTSSPSSSSPSVLGSDSLFSPARDASTPGSDIVHSSETCPKSKTEMVQRIVEEGDSPFAPPNNVRKSSDGVLGTMITCAGTAFPKTQKSDRNIEVLTAWRSIRADPQYKDADINELCSEFTKKARCDGTKVVLEPQGVHSILEALSSKKQ